MRISRRDFLKAAAAMVAAGKLAPTALADLRDVLRGEGDPRVIWLQGAGCDGCAISFLNSVHYATADDLLINTLDVEFQNNLMAAAGDLAVSAVDAAAAEPGYVLIVEGAIPTGAGGKYCWLWPGTTMYDGLLALSQDAGFIIALGSCASYGGVTAGAPNPTEAKEMHRFHIGTLSPDPNLTTSIENGWTVEADDHASAAMSFIDLHPIFSRCCIRVVEIDDDYNWVGDIIDF